MDTLTARAVANALWPRLKHWSWTPAKATRDLADYGDRPSIFVLGLPVWTYTAALLLAAIIRHRGNLTTTLT